jgi:hypothetical protein
MYPKYPSRRLQSTRSIRKLDGNTGLSTLVHQLRFEILLRDSQLPNTTETIQSEATVDIWTAKMLMYLI